MRMRRATRRKCKSQPHLVVRFRCSLELPFTSDSLNDWIVAGPAGGLAGGWFVDWLAALEILLGSSLRLFFV